MKNAVVIHGCCDEEEYYHPDYPSPSNFHWIPWLQKNLLVNGYECQTPEMPEPFAPDYNAWSAVFSRHPVDENTTLIGHSCGGGFLLKWLTLNKRRIDKLILVAPTLDPNNNFGAFLRYERDSTLSEYFSEIHIFYSEDEIVAGIRESIEEITALYLSAKLHTFKTKGHFCLGDMGTEQFPELLEVIL